jgi:hypothetical protein
VGDSRQNAEPGIGYSRSVPAAFGLTTAEQLKELDGVGSADTVGITYYNHRGHRESRYGC